MNSNTEILSYGYSKIEEELKKEEKKLKIIQDTEEKIKNLNTLKVFTNSIANQVLKVYVEEHLKNEIQACELKVNTNDKKVLKEIINKLKQLKDTIPTLPTKPKKTKKI